MHRLWTLSAVALAVFLLTVGMASAGTFYAQRDAGTALCNGVPVSWQGESYFLTAGHCVEGKSFWIASTWHSYLAEPVIRGDSDWSLLKTGFPFENSQKLERTPSLSPGKSVYIRLRKGSYRFKGSVFLSSEDAYGIYNANRVRRGDSGSPVYYKDGRLIAIITHVYPTMARALKTNRIVEGLQDAGINQRKR